MSGPNPGESSADKRHPAPGPEAQNFLAILAELCSGDRWPLKRNELGFDWWPGHFKVSVIAHSMYGESGEEVRLAIRTEFLKNVPLGEQKCRKVAVALGAYAPLFAWTFIPSSLEGSKFDVPTDRTIWLQSVFYLNKESARSMTRLVALTIFLQALTAEFQSEPSAKLLNAEPDVSSLDATRTTDVHPDLLRVQLEIAAAGEAVCPLADSDEFELIAREYGKGETCFGTGDRTGLTLETPIGESSALILVRTDIKHPGFGNGLLSSVELPFLDTEERITDLCSEANFMDASTWSNAPLYSGWHPRQNGDGTAWRAGTGTFLPNAYCGAGFPTHFALSQVFRARFIKSTFWPDLKDLTMAEVFNKRMSMATRPE